MHANGEHIRIRLTGSTAQRLAPSAWHPKTAGLTDLQEEYAAWLDALPANQQDSAMAEALRAIVELDLSELQAIVPPRGFGRD